MSVATRVVTMTLLVAAGIGRRGVSGLSPAKAAETPAPPLRPQPESNGQRFDLSYLSPDAMGVYAVRPAAIFRIPGLKPHFDNDRHRDRQRASVRAAQARIDRAGHGRIQLASQRQSKKRPGRIVTGDWMVRTVKDFDWKPPIKMLVKTLGHKPGELVEVRTRTASITRRSNSGFLGRAVAFTSPTREPSCAVFTRTNFASGSGRAERAPRVSSRRRLAAGRPRAHRRGD